MDSGNGGGRKKGRGNFGEGMAGPTPGKYWSSSELTCTNFVAQRDLEVSVITPELLLAPFTDKGKEVSTGVISGIDTRTENQNR